MSCLVDDDGLKSRTLTEDRNGERSPGIPALSMLSHTSVPPSFARCEAIQSRMCERYNRHTIGVDGYALAIGLNVAMVSELNIPAPRGARPRRDIRPRVLGALTPEPATATEIAERAGLSGRERTLHAANARARLQADGFAIRGGTPQAPRWSRATDPAAARSEHDPAA